MYYNAIPKSAPKGITIMCFHLKPLCAKVIDISLKSLENIGTMKKNLYMLVIFFTFLTLHHWLAPQEGFKIK